MFDLLALAWAADITRVATLTIAKEVSNTVYPASGISDPFHNLSHHSEVPANIDRYARLNEYHTRSTFAYFLSRLNDTPDGDGSLLDHSLVLYGSGMSNSNQHDHDPLPTLVAGGASGAMAGGRHIRAGAGTPMANLLVGAHFAIITRNPALRKLIGARRSRRFSARGSEGRNLSNAPSVRAAKRRKRRAPVSGSTKPEPCS